MGLAQRQLWQLGPALSSYEAALRTYRNCLPTEEHASIAAVHVNIGLAHLAAATARTSTSTTGEDGLGPAERRAAAAAARASLDIAQALRVRLAGGDARHPSAMAVQVHVAAAARAQGCTDEAERLLVEAVAALRTREPSGIALANALNNLGVLRRASGAPARAAENLTESLAIREARLGRRHPDTVTAMHNLAEARAAAGDEAAAASLRSEILARLESTDLGAAPTPNLS